MLLEANVTVTDATGTFDTVTSTDPLLPSLVAVIVVVPTPMADTMPLWVTLATRLFPEDQATVRPPRTLLLASRRTALACVV